MNDFRLSFGIEFENNYIDAKNKLTNFIAAFSKLTEMQKQQLANEFITSVSMAASLEQFINYMNSGGRF